MLSQCKPLIPFIPHMYKHNNNNNNNLHGRYCPFHRGCRINLSLNLT